MGLDPKTTLGPLSAWSDVRHAGEVIRIRRLSESSRLFLLSQRLTALSPLRDYRWTCTRLCHHVFKVGGDRPAHQRSGCRWVRPPISLQRMRIVRPADAVGVLAALSGYLTAFERRARRPRRGSPARLAHSLQHGRRCSIHFPLGCLAPSIRGAETMTTRHATCSCGQLRITAAGEPVRISCAIACSASAAQAP